MSSSAPKRRSDIPQQAPSQPGARRAARPKRSSRTLRATPAALGSVALVAAGLGAVGVTTSDDATMVAANYQTISSAYTGSGVSNAELSVDVSRDFDRATLMRQAKTQAAQREQALTQFEAKTERRADELQAAQWVLPVAGYRLTAVFGQSSSLWSSGSHTGLDFAGPSGSEIVSVAAGTVTESGYAGAYGLQTVITLDDGTEVTYAHQSSTTVSVGEQVAPGQTIGYTGSTGNVTGPHLHLEIIPAGGDIAVDPVPVLEQHNIQP